MNFRINKWLLVAISLYAVVFVVCKNRSSWLRLVMNCCKKEPGCTERIKKFYSSYEQAKMASWDKKNVKENEEGNDHYLFPFDYSRVLLLLDETNFFFQKGPLFDFSQVPIRKHLTWLRDELRGEESHFGSYWAGKRRNKAKRFSSRDRRSMQFYLRAIKSSIEKVEKMLIRSCRSCSKAATLATSRFAQLLKKD